MELGLEGKVALVTGGSKGIGKATAMALAKEGVDVAICARGVEDLESAADEIRAASGRRVLPVRADTSSAEDISALFDAVVREMGGLDILVNNAVNSVAAPFMDLPDDAWINHFTVKVMGYVRCAREAIPHMKRRGGGRIISIGGMAARSVDGLLMTNGASNSAVSNFSKNLANDMAKDGILVNCIHPGATRTDRLAAIVESGARKAGISVEQAMRDREHAIPIGRMTEPEEVGSLVLFLASEKAGSITGQTIGIEGGVSVGIYY